MQINSLLKECGLNSYLYSLNLVLTDEHLKSYSGIKYVCMQGSMLRSKVLAQKLASTIYEIDTEISITKASINPDPSTNQGDTFGVPGGSLFVVKKFISKLHCQAGSLK